MCNIYNNSESVATANICEFIMGHQVKKKQKQKICEQLTSEGPCCGLVLRLNVQMY
jgi:hypothetical protein